MLFDVKKKRYILCFKKGTYYNHKLKKKINVICKVRTHQEGKYEENMLPLFPSSLTWARKFHTQDEWKDLCLFLF